MDQAVSVPVVTLTPGIHVDVPANVYHADPAEHPSLSASIANAIVTRSPRHAWHNHPRLNPEWEPAAETDAMEHGSLLHAMMAGEDLPPLVVVDAKNRTVKAWKEAEAAAIADKKTPILKRHFDNLQRCANAARSQIMEFSEALLPPGVAEAVAICQVGPTSYRRLRVDHLPNDPSLPVLDFKFTEKNGAPGEWERTVIKEHSLRAAFYMDTLYRIRGVCPSEYRFAVIETKPPYCLSVLAPGPKLLDIGRRRMEYAQREWDHAMDTGTWGAYPDRVCYVDAPFWTVKEQDARELRDLQQAMDDAE